MSFIKKTWTDRLVEFPGRRKLTNVTSNTSAVYDVERAEGVVSQNGSAFSAENMNDLETRIEAAINSEETNNESTYVKKAGDTLTGPLKWLLNKGEVFFDKIASSETWHLVYKKNKASSWSKTIMTVTPTLDGNSATATFDGDATSAGTARKLGDVTVGSAARGMYLNLGTPTPLNPLESKRALVSDASGNVAVSAVTAEELGRLDGVTENVQSKFNWINNNLKIDGSWIPNGLDLISASASTLLQSYGANPSLYAKQGFPSEANPYGHYICFGGTYPILIYTDVLGASWVYSSNQSAWKKLNSSKLDFLDTLTGNVQTQLNNIGLTVNGEGKLVFKNAAGADSVLPFSRGEITAESVVKSEIVIALSSNIASASYVAQKESYVFAAYAANITEGTLDAQSSGGTVIVEKTNKIGYQTMYQKIIKVPSGTTLNMSAVIPVQLGGGHAMLGYFAIVFN